MDAHFSHANVTDFDIIHHPCCADPLQNSQAYYETIFNSDRKFSAEDIECIAECFNEQFERFSMSRLKWISKPKIENSLITTDFPFSIVFVYSKNNNNESRYCWQTLPRI